MPTYEFECQDCGQVFEQAMTMTEHDEKSPKCPKCGSEKVEHVFEAVNVSTSKKS